MSIFDILGISSAPTGPVTMTGQVGTKNGTKYQWSDGVLTWDPFRTDVQVAPPPGPTYTATPVPGATYSGIYGWVGPDGKPLTQAQLTRPDGTHWINTTTGGGPGSGGSTVTGGQWGTSDTAGGLFGMGGGFLGLGDVQAALPVIAAIAAGTGGLDSLLSTPTTVADTAAPAVIDSAGNLIGGELANGVATSTPVLSGSTATGLLSSAAAAPAVIDASGNLIGGTVAPGAVGSAATDASLASTAGAATGAAATTPALAGGAITDTAGQGAGAAITSGSATGATAATGGLLSGAGTSAATTGAGMTLADLLSGKTSLTDALGSIPLDKLLSGGLTAAGSAANADAAKAAAQTQADAIIKAAQIAADAAKFKPVGVTTGFGSSKFGYDANGNLTSAGYELTPEMKAQRDALIGTSSGLLGQFQGSQAATAPMADAAQRAMTLGQGYLNTDPKAQAAQYYADQMKLLEPGRADALAQLQAQMQAQGRGGFAIGGGVGGMGAANPQLQALYNAQLQQSNQLAANATQGGMDYAKFGAGLVGTGGDLLSSMYGTQSASFNPYATALKGAQTVEGLGQNAMDMGLQTGSAVTAANAKAGGLLSSGMTSAASTMAPANAYSPWGALLSGAGSTMSAYKFDPMTGKAL
jgi:hypothetical protein